MMQESWLRLLLRKGHHLSLNLRRSALVVIDPDGDPFESIPVMPPVTMMTPMIVLRVIISVPVVGLDQCGREYEKEA
jgi:hypothetical protein